MIITDSQLNLLGYNAIVYPSNTGDDTANVQAAIDYVASLAAVDGYQYIVRLLDDEYILNKITLKNNVLIQGTGGNQTKITPNFTGTADDSLNSIFQAIGTINTTKCNTTITNNPLFEGQYSFTVTNAGTLIAGDYVIFTGNNSTLGGQAFLDSDGISVTWTSIHKIRSVSSNTITLENPCSEHRAIGTTVRAITPVINSGVFGMTIDASNQSAITAGILSRSTINFEIEDIALKGFSGFGIIKDLGSKDWKIKNIKSLGQNNGILDVNAAHYGYTRDITCDPTGLRYHLQGTPLGLIRYKNHPVSNTLTDIRLARGCFGIVFNAGVHNIFNNIHINDMDCRTTDAGGDHDGYFRRLNGSVKYGVAIDGVDGSNDYVEIPIDNKWNNITVEDIVCDLTHNYAAAIWEHDTQGSQWNNVTLINRGNTIWAGGTRGMRGFFYRDVYDSTITNVTSYGIYVHNIFDDATRGAVQIINAVYNNTASDSGVNTFPFYLAQKDITNMRMKNIRMANITTPFLFRNATFIDYSITLEDFESDQNIYSKYAIICKNESGVALTSGHIVKFLSSSPAGTRKIQKATSSDTNIGVWIAGWDDALGDGKGFGFVAPVFPCTVLCNGTVNFGDLLEISSTDGELVANNSSTRPVCRALDNRSGAGSSRVKAGPVF